MSQYYPQQGPGYPPPPPPQLPPQTPEEYYEEGDYEYEEIEETGFTTTQMAMAFFGGGCLVFVCVSICALVLAVLWVIDPGAEGSSDVTSLPGSDIGLSFTDPAYPNESVVNDQGIQLTILDVNRNASVEAIPTVEGRETIIVTVELVNMGENDSEFSERDFLLLNAYEEAYAATPGAIAGALGRGTLPPNEGLEGRLVYETTAGEIDLQLLWEVPESTARYIWLQ